MSNDLNDGADDSFDELEDKKQGRSLGDLWRDSAAFKVGAVVVAAVVIFGAISMMGGPSQPPSQSMLPAGSEISAPPGTEEASPAYVQAVEEENQTRVETAIKEGSSALPTPIEPAIGGLSVPEEPKTEEDPLQRWRKLQEERLERELQNSNAVNNPAIQTPAVEDQARAETLQALADSMTEQMQSILDNRSAPKAIQTKSLTSPKWLEDMKAEEEQKAAEAAAAQETPPATETILAPAGEIYYAQMITEANNEAPGPVLAQIMSGPLIGSRIIGDFDEQEEVLTIQFNTVVVNGESIGIDAIALDIETTLPGIATEVDHRYLRRIALPAAAAFIEGMGTAIAESGRTTVTIQGETVAEEEGDASNDQEVATGVEEAAQEVGEILDDINEDTGPLIRVEKGTAFGLLFLEPVIKTEGEVKKEEEEPQNSGNFFPPGTFPGGFFVPTLPNGVQNNGQNTTGTGQ
jgi:intracellular multiplication protein IcmE